MDGVRVARLHSVSISFVWTFLVHAFRSSLRFVLRLVIVPIIDNVRTRATSNYEESTTAPTCSVVDATPSPSNCVAPDTNTRDDAWSNGLPDDIVLQIWTRLSVFDSTRFRSVCSSWWRVASAAAAENRKLDPSYSTHGIRMSPPCLLVYSTSDKRMCLVSFHGQRKSYRPGHVIIRHANVCVARLSREQPQGDILQLPIHSKACLGSVDGWFIMGIAPNSQPAPQGCIHCARCTAAYIFLLNPITNRKVSLHPFPTTDAESAEGLETSLKVVASAPPSSLLTGDFVVALLRIKEGELYVCRPGRHKWNNMSWRRVRRCPTPTFLDIAFGAGRRLYAVTRDMVWVFTWDPNPSKPEEADPLTALETLRVTSQWPAVENLRGASVSSYLVPGLEGKLFLFCHGRRTDGVVTHPVRFRAFKLSRGPSPDENQWVRIHSFEEQRVLFLNEKGGRFVNKSDLPDSFMQHFPADTQIWFATKDILLVGVLGNPSLNRWTKECTIRRKNTDYFVGWHATWFVPKPW